MPISCHFRDCKALLSMCSSWSSAISRTWPLPLSLPLHVYNLTDIRVQHVVIVSQNQLVILRKFTMISRHRCPVGVYTSNSSSSWWRWLERSAFDRVVSDERRGRHSRTNSWENWSDVSDVRSTSRRQTATTSRRRCICLPPRSSRGSRTDAPSWNATWKSWRQTSPRPRRSAPSRRRPYSTDWLSWHEPAAFSSRPRRQPRLHPGLQRGTVNQRHIVNDRTVLPCDEQLPFTNHVLSSFCVLDLKFVVCRRKENKWNAVDHLAPLLNFSVHERFSPILQPRNNLTVMYITARFVLIRFIFHSLRSVFHKTFMLWSQLTELINLCENAAMIQIHIIDLSCICNFVQIF